MIYLVSREKRLFSSSEYEELSIEDSISLINNWGMVQFDTETSGRDARLCQILCMQFGDIEGKAQVVVDTTTVSPLIYKEILESKYIVGQNLKFDIEFLYNYGIVRPYFGINIIPRRDLIGFATIKLRVRHGIDIAFLLVIITKIVWIILRFPSHDKLVAVY